MEICASTVCLLYSTVRKKLTIKSNDKPSKHSLLRKNLRILNRLRKKGQKSFFNIKKTFAKYTKISR